MATLLTPEGLARTIDEMDNLPSIPAVATRALEMARDPDVNFHELSKLIHTDPPLAARLMKLANSAYYGRRKPAVSLDEALVTVGLNEAVTIISGVGFMRSFDNWEQMHLERAHLWRHSLCTGFLARSLQQRNGKKDKTTPNLFLSGLLHHIGWIVLDYAVPELLGAALVTAEELDEWSLELERDLLGLTHPEVSAIFLQKWQMNEQLCTIVEHQHSPGEAGELAVYADLIQVAAHLSPHKFPVDSPITGNAKYFRKEFQIAAEHDLIPFLEDNYPDHVKQAGALTTLMTAEF